MKSLKPLTAILAGGRQAKGREIAAEVGRVGDFLFPERRLPVHSFYPPAFSASAHSANSSASPADSECF